MATDGRLAEPLRVGHRAADAGGARGLARAARRRGRAGRPGRAAERPARGRGVLSAHVRRAGARRQRDRERLAACPEDRAPGPRRRQRVDPAGPRTGPRRDRGRVRAAPARGCAVGRRARRGAALLRRARAASRPTRPAIQLGLRAFERALGVRPALIRTGGTCRSSPPWPTRGSRRSSPASRCPDAQHPRAQRAPARGVRAAGDRRGPGAVRGAGGV